MADQSKIEWTDATWQPVTGCSIVSPGCTNCYAMKLADTRLRHHPSRAGLTIGSKAGPVWNGKVRFNEQWLDQPLRWKSPRRIFVCAHGDLFHENVPDEWIDMVFAVMALAPQHTFQVLTKRSARMRRYMTRGGPTLQMLAQVPQVGRDLMVANTDWPLPNVWLGVSTERQQEADERIPDLIETPAAVRFISAEPLLGPISLFDFIGPWSPSGDVASHAPPQLDWVIVGGESGTGARPMHPDWARSLRDQCAAAGVPFFFKQWGEWVPQVGAVDGWTIDDNPEISRFDHRDWDGDRYGEPYRPMWCDDRDDDTVARVGKKAAGRLLDGVEHNGMPDCEARPA